MNAGRDVGGVNISSDYNSTAQENNPWYQTVLHFQTGILIVVVIVGLVGNILAAGTFLSPNLRKTSCCLYLATKSINDLLFLLSLVIVWLYRLDVPVFETIGVCQATVFVTYTTGFLSVWFVVIITWENFIRVSLPSHVARLCNVKRAKYTIVILIIISVGMYSFSLWTTGLISSRINSSCLVFEKYEKLLVAMTCVDSILTLVIPLIVMVFLNIAISITAIQSHERRKRLFESIPMTSIHRRNETSVLEMKVSKLLFAVSIIFLLLHTPSHVIRIKMMVLQSIYKTKPSLSDRVLHRIFELVYYMNFSVHCGVYLVFGDNFRMIFKRLYCSGCKKAENAQIHTSSKRCSETEAMFEQCKNIDIE
ncbi:G-protein coupled receptor 183-A-like [Haliotis rufescens]|uniref:G-protein coupled receptor 183-A-like n=1 Tax=Haliotis rufescens TaxID=6454 RepID=UPI001EAFF9FB|nr:G-protein coupled receptor 183-A-like [Haliotis rufescens]